MNWYRTAQQIYETDQHKIDYMDIGHNQWKKDHGYKNIENTNDIEEYLWMIIDGTLHVSPSNKSHGGTGDIEIDRKFWQNGTIWKGRFSNSDGKKIISISGPPSSGFREIPSVILNMLYDRFGNDINIYRY